MDAAVFSQFLQAAVAILSGHFGLPLKPLGEAETVSGAAALDPVTVMLGITGDVEGQVLMGCQTQTALAIARTMLQQPDYPELDELCVSALAELGNMISGRAATGLSGLGFMCNLTPPSVVFSADGRISLGLPAMIALPFSTPVGELRIRVGLRNINHQRRGVHVV